MDRHSTYAFLHARLGAMKSEFLGISVWQQLLSATDFSQQQQILAETCYGAWLQGSVEDTSRSIRGDVYRAARKIERSVPTPAARFIQLWARRDLLRNLKAILKGKAIGSSESTIRSDLLVTDPMYPLPIEPLLHCNGVEAALDLLETTSLRHWIRAARRIYQRDHTLFGLDAALDRFYYVELWQQLRRLSPADQEKVKGLVSAEIDQVNLLWLLRYRLHYGLSPAETYFLLTRVTGHVTKDELKQLVREESLETIISQVSFQPLRVALQGCQSIWQVEVALWRYRARLARKLLTAGVFTLGEAFAVLLLKVVELRNLVATLHGTMLGVDRPQIEAQLVGVPHG